MQLIVSKGKISLSVIFITGFNSYQSSWTTKDCSHNLKKISVRFLVMHAVAYINIVRANPNSSQK